MSTFKIEDSKIMDMLFPENKWEALDEARYAQVFDRLLGEDPLRSEMLKYTEKRRPKIGFHQQYKSGGGWTVRGNITLSPGDDPLSPYVLSLIIHETYHLTQSILTRLSMQGELRAWQCQARTYPAIAGTKGARIGSHKEAYCRYKNGTYEETCEYWEQLLQLSPDARDDLEKAQDVMRAIAPGYRSNALPLYPIHQEIWFYLKRGRFDKIWEVIRNMVTAAG